MAAENLTLRRPFYKYLRNAAGDTSAIGDYSGTASTFYLQPAAGVNYRLIRMMVHVKDTAGMDADQYGNNITLANGIQINLTQDGTTIDLVDTLPLKTNGAWAQLCHDAVLLEWGTGNEILTCRWTFAKSNEGFRLIGDNEDRFEIILSDDFEGLLDHTFMMEGEWENAKY